MALSKQNKSQEFKRKMALRFLQSCGWDIEELPTEAWLCMRNIDYGIYTVPLIKADYEAGVGVGMLAKRYRLSPKQIRRRLQCKTWAGTHTLREE